MLLADYVKVFHFFTTLPCTFTSGLYTDPKSTSLLLNPSCNTRITLIFFCQLEWHLELIEYYYSQSWCSLVRKNDELYLSSTTTCNCCRNNRESEEKLFFCWIENKIFTRYTFPQWFYICVKPCQPWPSLFEVQEAKIEDILTTR